MSLLDVQGLSIRFGGLQAVSDVGFSVNEGEIVSVIGPNGAGKTTLFNMISGVYKPSAGKVLLNDEDVTAISPHLLARRGMSRTFQNLQIFQNMTVLENAITGYHLKEKGRSLRIFSIFILRASAHGMQLRARSSFSNVSVLTVLPSGKRERFPMER